MMMEEGRPQKQAVAIALETAREAKKKTSKSGSKKSENK